MKILIFLLIFRIQESLDERAVNRTSKNILKTIFLSFSQYSKTVNLKTWDFNNIE